MYNLSHVAAYEPNKLSEIHHEFILERMKYDKDFSNFLDVNEWKLGEDTSTDIWDEYRSMGMKYTKLINDIKITEYYLKRI